jgi:uncharacterized protein (TIGR02301 family)
MMFRNAACAAILALSVIATPASAQQEGVVRGEDWYRAQLVELSEVLGGAHYLRILCDGRGDQRWRNYMRGVIDREPEYNAALVEGFNRGYRNEEARCSRRSAKEVASGSSPAITCAAPSASVRPSPSTM